VPIHRYLRVPALLSFGVLSGCTMRSPQNPTVPATLSVRGTVHGGQQPVANATIQLYASNITATAGSSTALIVNTTVTTASDGSFNIPINSYSCPTNTATPIYLSASGGNPLPSNPTPNASLVLIAALGPCSGLSSSTNVNVNEVTTVAAVWAFGAAITDYLHVGATSLSAMTSAFTLAQQYANTASGQSPGTGVAAGSYIPTAKIYTMANILAACVNTDGTGSTGNSTLCGQLFTDTTYSGTRPTDTVGAAIAIAANASTNPGTIFGLASTTPPFQPALANAPTDWNMTIAAVSWAAPTPISNGVALSITQLSATATVPGTFVYSPAAGVVPAAGTQSLATTFTPSDTTDYPTINAGTSLSVYNPSYTFGNVAIVGGGYVDGIVVHPTQPNIRYARTDVGGAYRWDQPTSRWVSLIDFIGDNNRSGCESIALDPTNYLNVYLACGEYSESYGENGLFLISTNGGTSFSQVAAPFKMGSNDPGRTAGERMAVDPNLPAKLYYGSYRDGLWVSTNSGSNWSKVTTFPVYSTTTGGAGTGGVPPNSEDYTGYAGAGVVFVQFVGASGTSGTATPVIYVGVSDTGTSGTGYSSLYVSTNGGTTWTAVAGQPTGAYPIKSSLAASPAGANTLLYIAYSSGALWANSSTITQGIGPDSVTGGSLYKYTLPTSPGATGGSWTNITPTNTTVRPSYTQGGFASIVADPNNLGVVMATTLDDYYPGDDIYRSLNYGATWESVLRITNNPTKLNGATYTTTLSPWVTFGGSIGSAGTWPTSLAIDPANSDHVLYGTGQTLWDSTNIQLADSAGKVTFTVGAAGIEETVVQALASPPAGPILYSGVDDLGGFVHTSLTTSPASGMILNDAIDPINSFDFGWSLPATVAFIGSSGSASYGAYSTNAGSSWTKFAAIPSGTTSGSGQIAVSANAATFVWAPSDAAVAYSTNNGSTWTASTGATAHAGVIADRVNANKFYIYNPSNGGFQISTNAGQSFSTLSGTGLPTSNTSGQVYASYAAEGDLWIAFSSHGLYHSTNSGSTWTSVTGSPSNEVALGFGAPAVGGTYPAMYILTSSGNINGFYRSINEGTSWTQINTNTTNQYGYVHVITGDPKTFGNVYLSTGGRGVVLGTSTY
jgi:hypothetical protein